MLWLMKKIMSNTIKKILPVIFFGCLLGLVVWFTSPPASLTEASVFQLLLFFIPLFFLLTFTINLCFDLFSKSLVLSIGILLLLIFRSLDLLNIFSFLLISLATIFLAVSIKKSKTFGQPKIQSLKLRKQH